MSCLLLQYRRVQKVKEGDSVSSIYLIFLNSFHSQYFNFLLKPLSFKGNKKTSGV